MPYKITKKNCKQSSGKKGKYVVSKKSDSKKKSCHTSKKKAQSAVRARYANESEIRKYIRTLLESNQQTKFDAILRRAIADLEKLNAEENKTGGPNSKEKAVEDAVEDAVEEIKRLLGGN